MNPIRVAALSLGLLTTVASAQFTYDISGMEAWGGEGHPMNDARVFDVPDTFFNVILEVRYDITLQTFGESTFSEVMFRYGNSDGTFHGDWPETFAPGEGNSGTGTERFVGSFLTDFHLNDDLEFHLSMFDTLDDPNTDAVVLDGSSVTLNVFIPSPGTGMVLGCAGLLAARRRR